MHRLRTFPCFHSALRLSLLALLALSLAACGVDAGSAPTLTPDPGLPATAAALFPTTAPTHAPTPTPLAESDAAESIARLLRQMQNAVLARDEAAYLALVDLDADETFRQEHTRWVEDWATAGGGLLRFELALRNLTLNADGKQATADLNMAWSHLGSVQVSRGADFPVRFTRGDAGRWRYAGEHWAAELETEHFIVKAQPGLEPRLEALTAYLPEVYSRVTQSLDHAPQDKPIIKLYDTPWALVATTRLSLTQEISGWHEPGEALKVVAAATADESTIAHEFAHAILFDLAGGTRGTYPWWVSEGAA
ncbi:MAG: hypothetical protein JXN59_01915, partial [Anaerolineae bacterium]|nr:hypothetical protein [Anaerolineae bacterium]